MPKEAEAKPAEKATTSKPAAPQTGLEQDGIPAPLPTGKVFALPRSMQRRQVRAMQRIAGNRFVQRTLTTNVIQRGKESGDLSLIPTLPDLESKRALALKVLKKAYGGLIKQETEVAGVEGLDALFAQYDQAMISQDKYFRENGEDRKWKVNDAKNHPNMQKDFAGFNDPSSKKIFIDTKRQPDEQVATIGHELLHANASGEIISTFGRRVDEGMTESLMKKAFAKSGFSAPGNFFAEEITFVERLNGMLGENTMMSGYFGSLAAARSLMDTTFDKVGKFDSFAQFVRKGDWTSVNQIFDSFQKIRQGSEVEKKRAAILGLMNGWVFSDADLADVRNIWSGCSEDEKRELRPSIEANMNALSDHGDRAELRIIIGS
jgi:hypothetical protein